GHALVDAERVQERRASGTKQVQVGEVLLHEETPGELERERRARLEAEERGRRILDLALPRTVDAGRDRADLRHAQHPERQVDHLEAQIEDDAATRFALPRAPLVRVPLRLLPEPAALGE